MPRARLPEKIHLAAACELMADDTPDLLTLKDVIAKTGRGRTWLLAHLKANPFFGGKPTHRRAGNRIVFTHGDYANLLESLVPEPKEAPKPGAGSKGSLPPLSTDGGYARALALLEARKAARKQKSEHKRR